MFQLASPSGRDKSTVIPWPSLAKPPRAGLYTWSVMSSACTTRALLLARGHRSLLPTPFYEGADPLTATIRRESDPAQRRAGAVDEQGTQVHITPLTHAKQPWPPTRRMLTRHPPLPPRQTAGHASMGRSTDGGHEGRGCQRWSCAHA